MPLVEADHPFRLSQMAAVYGLGPMSMIVVAPPFEGQASPGVHRLAGMPAARSGTGDLEVVAEHGAIGKRHGPGHLAHDHFGHGRPTDVSGAYEVHAQHVAPPCPVRTLSLFGLGTGPFCPAGRGLPDRGSGYQTVGSEVMTYGWDDDR